MFLISSVKIVKFLGEKGGCIVVKVTTNGKKYRLRTIECPKLKSFSCCGWEVFVFCKAAVFHLSKCCLKLQLTEGS